MKPFLYFVGGALLVLLGVIALNAYLGTGTEGGEDAEMNVTTHAAYFEERMITLGIEDIGQPIEGFDANLLIMAYPGLMVSDFEGVAALEGRYEVVGDELEFVRSQAMPMSSAERTVASEGYVTLLANVAERLRVAPDSEETIDAIIAELNTGERLETRIDQGASALGVKVTPRAVVEDSRCPIDATCVQAGTVRVRAQLASGLGDAEQEFVLNQPVTTEAEIVTLEQVVPEPAAGTLIDPSEYTFYFSVTKR